MAIEPDTKNWTWVIEAACPDCGFDGSAVTFRDVPAVIDANTDGWPEQLRRPDVRERPDESTWSPLEYGAHVRDVHRKMTERLELMLAEEDPLFPNWDQDATAVADRYAEQDPATVTRELLAAADRAVSAFGGVPDHQLARTGRRSDGSVFTVATLAVYYAHDPVHHLWDVRRSR
ncbi:DinB family protein [Curtobacterium sp. MCPF17_050]|uniref:DinB family protein n=1 Tax=unclassified Curtobacterium TaxID=257496 RepID=UPI000D9AC4DE|nr:MULTISPECIES: DinB family protein [unclassified Curtobacterium]PYY50399.1 DinB family protein [Curtobacterium sp. MCBD17_023]WIB14776.1 DinB family protein [Curtobacterium sp. MCPF17_050]